MLPLFRPFRKSKRSKRLEFFEPLLAVVKSLFGALKALLELLKVLLS